MRMTHEPPSHTLANLNKALAETMPINGQDPAILDQQTALLNTLFAGILDQQVAPYMTQKPWNNTEAQAWLKLALQCQKQCNDTLKSRAAIDYMQSLQMPGTLPLPAKIVKQNE